MVYKILVDGIERDATEEENAQIEAKKTVGLTEEYKNNRMSEYPDFRDYLDGIVKGDQAQVQKYIDACNAVKAKYPKSL
jgi:hypothetical protein